MSKPIEMQDVREKLADWRESDEPDAVLEALKPMQGRRFTVHLLRRLPGGEARWGYRHTAGMVYLEDSKALAAAYRDKTQARQKRSDAGISLLLSYNTSGPGVVDTAWIEERNASYFAGRRERNARRQACLDDALKVDEMARALNAYQEAKAALDKAKASLDKLTAYGKPFSPDQYDWERLCGAREPRE